MIFAAKVAEASAKKWQLHKNLNFFHFCHFFAEDMLNFVLSYV